MAYISPKDNSYLIGHEKAEKLFLDCVKRNTLHHAFLIDGMKGIGKATFAYKIARFLLATNESDYLKCVSLNILETNPVFSQISGGSHPNFKLIERGYTETDKKKVIKAIRDGEPMDEDDLQSLKRSAVIKVDEIREINQFLSKKSFGGSWRVVLIDSVDDLNTASANAILKILEEPPEKSVLLLISHNPSKLLPTIRSRCSRLHLDVLSTEMVATLLRRYLPELSEKKVVDLAKISQGSIGRALDYAHYDALNIYEIIKSVFCSAERFDLSQGLELANLAASDENIWEIVINLMLQFISEMVKSGEHVDELFALYTDILKQNQDVIALNMDKRQAIIHICHLVTKAVSNVG